MKIRTLLTITTLYAQLLTPHASATSVQVAPAEKSPDSVIIPYDSSKPLAGQNPTQLYVPYERFLELWEKAKIARAGVKPLPANTSFVLNSAQYEGRLESGRVIFTATIDLATFDNPWVKVPMTFAGVNIGSLTLDGKPAVIAGDSIVVEKPGSHTVIAHFEISLPKNKWNFRWGVPRTTATRVKLTLPETRWTAKILPDCAAVEQIENGNKHILAALGSVSEVAVSIFESAALAHMTEPASATVETSLVVHPTYESVQTKLQYEFPGGQQERLAVNFGKDLTLINVDAPGMKSWKITESEERQTLEVALSASVKNRLALTLQFERSIGTQNARDRVAPDIRPGAKRITTTTGLFGARGLAIKPQPSSELRQAEAIACHEVNTPGQGAWTGNGELKYTVTQSAPKYEASVDTVYQVNRRKMELVSSFQLLAKSNPLFDVSLTLPEHFEVQGVESDRLQDWWRDGRKLHVRFKGSTPETTPLVIYLVRLYETAPQQLDVEPITLDGFAKVNGEAVIAAHKGVEATLKLTSENSDTKEIDPEKAAKSFSILPPLERKRGFVFKTQSFSGEVALSAVPPKTDVTWMLHAQAHETWASLSMKTEITIRQGSVDRTTFTLPASLPEARVTGSEVRETRSRVEGEMRIYEVSFHNDIHDIADFTVDLDVPMKENKSADGQSKAGALALPSPTFPGAQITTGYVMADNASDSEMKINSDGVDRVAASSLPWIPALSKSAGIFRVQPKWTLSITIERLEKAESREAFCAWADMTTAVRNDGTEWHKAVWHMQNRSLQFLPVKLPEGAELMSVRVAEQNVRADSGMINGQAAILVPLIKTRPGEISFDVEVVWRRIGKTPGKKDARQFDDAELPGITVEQTFWNVWLPENRALTKMEGNMQAAVEALNKVEKSSSLLDELKSLNTLLSSTVSSKTRKRAQATFDTKWGALNEDLKSQAVGRPYAAEVGKPDIKNEKQTAAMLQEANRRVGELEQELQKQLAFNKKLEATAPRNEYYYRGSGLPAEELDKAELGSDISYGSKIQSQQDRDQDETRWEKKKDDSRKLAPVETLSTGERQLFVNDSIVLNQAATNHAPKQAGTQPAKSRNKDIDDISVTTRSGQNESKETTKSFSSARGNVALQNKDSFGLRGAAIHDQPGRSSDGTLTLQADSSLPAQSAPEIPSTFGSGNSTNSGFVATGTHSFPVTPTTRSRARIASASPDSKPAADNAPLLSPPDEGRDADASNLQTAGRISLAVDFPLEGNVYHFKKVKANASLSIAFADTRTSHAWRNTTIFALLGLSLWLFGVWRENRNQTSEPSNSL